MIGEEEQRTASEARSWANVTSVLHSGEQGSNIARILSTSERKES